MQRFRTTIRRLMTAVAVVGLLSGMAVWGWRLKQRRDYCLKQESSHLQSEKLFRTIAKSLPRMPERQTVGAHDKPADDRYGPAIEPAPRCRE